jgi:nicotinamide riboside kinase
MRYTEADLLKIAKGQIALEDQYTHLIQKQNRALSLLFIDTNMYVMKVWGEFVFRKSDPWIINQLALRKYDLYLLCNIDLPWIKDELREYPDLQTRKRLYDIYRALLESQATPWTVISGNYEERLQNAIRAVDSFLATSLPDKQSLK